MPEKSDASAKPKDPASTDPLAQLQDAGLGNMMGMSAAWLDSLGKMGAEVASFVADRIQEDVKTQHEVLNCKSVEELQHVQAQFVQKAMDQYHAETGKLVELTTKAFAPKSDDI